MTTWRPFLAVYVLLACPVFAQPPNLLTNPAFDLADARGGPAAWSFGDYKTGGASLYDAKAGRNGSGAVGVRCATVEQRGSWQQSLPMGPGYVRVSGWYRTQDMAVGAQGATVRVTCLKGEKGWDFVKDERHALPATSEWTPFTKVFTVVANTGHIALELFNFFTPGTVWWDDVSAQVPTEQEINAMMAESLDRPPADGQIGYHPEAESQSSTNPPYFSWVPVAGISKYTVQVSRDPKFPAAATTTVDDLDLTVYTPTEGLKPGKWTWRYGYKAPGGGMVHSRPRAFSIPTDAVKFPRPTVDDFVAKVPATRPRIYFSPEKVAEVRADRDGLYKGLIRGIAGSADKRLGEALYPEPDWLPQESQERGKAYLLSFQTMRPFTSGMETCALAYVCTGDRKYADEAKRRLLHFATWKADGPTSVFHNDEAAMDIAMRGPRTYDWIYDTLTPEERATCEDFLGRRLTQINEMHRRMPFESRPYGSHQGRMIGFMVEGMIVFGHELPQARAWVDYYTRLLWSVYPVWGSDDGGWHEGIGYWTAYMSMMTMVIEELDRLGIPWKDKPYLQNTGYFGLYCAYPGRKLASFGDGQDGRVGGGQGNLLYALASIYDNPHFRWYAEHTGGGSPGGVLAFNLLRPDLKPKPPSDLPQARNFPHVGWVAMHSDMTNPANNILLLLHSSPYGATSHNHANQNAFVLEAFGEPLAISSGYYQRYGSPHHAQWTWETKAHSAILVDGKGQVIRSFASRGKITEFENSEQFCYTTGDATEAYGGRLKQALRHVLFVRPDATRGGYFIILDDLQAAEPATFQWLLHALSEMQLEPDKLALTSAQGEARLRVQFLTPTKLQFSQTDKFDVQPDKPVPNQWHFQAATTDPATAMRFVTVLMPYRNGQKGTLPACRLLPATGGVALQVGEDIIAWKDAEAKTVTAGDFSSEAQVTAVTRSGGQPRGMFLRGAGRVQMAGKALQP